MTGTHDTAENLVQGTAERLAGACATCRWPRWSST